MSQNHKIRWVLFHEPVELFVRTAEAFRDEIQKRTNGRIEIEIYKVDEYAKTHTGGAYQDALTLLNNGEIEMSQVATPFLGQANAIDFYALDLPFLFKDHTHASRVLEGPIGEGMLDSLSAKTQIKGLAFTYSGGYRCIAADKPIQDVEGLRGLSMAVISSPVNSDTANAFGTTPTVVAEQTIEERTRTSSTYDTIQTTLPRYAAQVDSKVHPYVVNTRHSMYLTTIIINEKFWAGLSQEDQLAMKETALICSRLERQWSVDDAAKIETDRAEQEKLGIKAMIELSESETQKLKLAAEPVLEKYKSVFSSGLVESILKA